MHYPSTNHALIDWVFGAMDEARNARLASKKHALMAILAIDSAYQRMGVGGKLLEWGLAKCDAEGLECWIDASDKGKGLYEKHGWKQVGYLDVDTGKWGADHGVVRRTAAMLRMPVKKES